MKIYPEEGSAIETIKNLPFFEFLEPTIIKDILKKKEVTPVIEIIEPPCDLTRLEDINLALYSIPIKRKDTWAKRQKCVYVLREIGMPIEGGAEIQKKLPANHSFEIDIANRKIRFHGPFISKNKNWTEWIFY